ncbi:MAG: hypothetical protein GXO55_02885 [Chloroflexi bacterium]|nr:hypothetical protein [Chloroflexota bacterium]
MGSWETRIEGLLNRIPPVANTRRNHAIEHATIHILSERLPGVSMAGRSTPFGFYIYGDIPTDALRDAVREAIRRLQEGEMRLAIHPHCGTNLVTASVLAGLAAVLSLAGKKRKWWDRLPTALVSTTLALAAAQPLGYWAQDVLTTDPHVSKAQLVSIRRSGAGKHKIHFVRLTHT